MKDDFRLTPARLHIEERECGLDEFLALAGEFVEPQTGWLLAESPRELVFRRMGAEIPDRLKLECSNMVIFGPAAEARLEKRTGTEIGRARLLRLDPAGEDFLARRTGALLRGGKGRLLHDEYFRPDASGVLIRICGRLCGVEES